MKSTAVKVEDMFGDVIGKDNVSQDQTIKQNNFWAKMM